MVHSLINPVVPVTLPHTFQVLAMTKSGGQAMIIRVAKRPQLFLFLLQSFFPLKCLCPLAYLVSFGKQPDKRAYEGKADTKPNRPGSE